MNREPEIGPLQICTLNIKQVNPKYVPVLSIFIIIIIIISAFAVGFCGGGGLYKKILKEGSGIK